MFPVMIDTLGVSYLEFRSRQAVAKTARRVTAVDRLVYFQRPTDGVAVEKLLRSPKFRADLRAALLRLEAVR